MNEKKLIKEVRAYEHLYAKASSSYRDKFKRAQAWAAISAKMRLSEEECQRRWRSLRDRFVRENSKNYWSGSVTSDPESEWELYPHLSFLLDHIRPRQSNPFCYKKKSAMVVRESLSPFTPEAAFDEELIDYITEPEDIEKRLINEVRAHENLYAKGSQSYRDKAKRMQSWSEISDKLNVSEEDCQKRWRNMRDRYVREYAKKLKFGSDPDNEWELIPYLNFLQNHIRPRNIISSATVPDCPSPSTLEVAFEEELIDYLTEPYDFEMRLINEVRAHENLYARESSSYRDKIQKAQAWAEVGAKINASEEECQKRWRTLRDRFVLENIKSAANDTESEWDLYPHLSFLEEHLKPIKMPVPECLPPPSPEAAFEEELMDDNEELLDTSISRNPRNTRPNRKRKRNSQQARFGIIFRNGKRRSEDMDNQIIDFTEFMKETMQQKFAKKDPNESFLQMLSEKLSELPQDEQEESKIYILNYMFDKVRRFKQDSCNQAQTLDLYSVKPHSPNKF